jgi:hypothetical protein
MPLRRGRKLRHATRTCSSQPQNRQGGAGPGCPEATFRRQCSSASDGCSCSWRVMEARRVTPTGRLRSALEAFGRCHRTEAGHTPHRTRMILAAITTGVLFFPGALAYLRLLRFPAATGQLGCGRAPTVVEDPGWRSATLTDWPMTVRG